VARPFPEDEELAVVVASWIALPTTSSTNFSAEVFSAEVFLPGEVFFCCFPAISISSVELLVAVVR
jgi:hypothetical protein